MAEYKSFPVIATSMWMKLRIQFKKSIPGTISSTYIASVFAMSNESAKTNVLVPLTSIGLIDKDGKTNQEMARKLRDDSIYPQLCTELLEKLYPQELRDAFPDVSSNRDRIKSWFMNHTGAGDSAAGKMTAFYLLLLTADPEIKELGNGKPKESKPREQRKNQIIRSAKAQPVIPPSEHELNPPNNLAQNKGKQLINPELNINIQIHISSDASPDQIKSIFENMATYLKS